MSCGLRVFQPCRCSYGMSHTQGWRKETNRGVKFSPGTAQVTNAKAVCANLFEYESSRVHKVCAWNGAHLRAGKYIIVFLAFLWFSLDRTIWKMSRHVLFHRVCAAHLAHPKYTPLQKADGSGFARFCVCQWPWVAEPFSKWGGTSDRQKSIENFCGLNWQLWRQKHWNMTSLTFVSMFYAMFRKPSSTPIYTTHYLSTLHWLEHMNV